jgi:hypothetical protein
MSNRFVLLLLLFLKFIRHKIFSSKHALQKFHVLVNGEKFDEKYDSFMNNVYQNK